MDNMKIGKCCQLKPVIFDKITVEVQKKGLDINDKLKKKFLNIVDKLVQVPTQVLTIWIKTTIHEMDGT